DKHRWKGGGDGGKPWSQSFVLRSRPFEAYYQAMGIMPKEEWPVFMNTLKEPLPACFRIHSDCSFKDQVKKQLLKLLEAPMVIEGKEVKAVRELPWYAGGLAYRLGCDRRFIRKQPHLAEFHKWLTGLMESGNITRQEAVSMLPPLFLDVQPKHLVLDMCAAPGSKTAQLMEMISAPSATATAAGEEEGGEGGPDGEVGLVVANDSDRDRAYMLAHQCKRVQSPAICITWCSAQSLPNLGAAGAERGSDKGVFDRVLADVPCSGDGTLRKQPAIWRTWTVAGGLGLHPLQLLITLRGAAMLKIGGKMVYSTCSLNPIEDEAVVAEVLRRCGGNLELEDCHSTLPGLKTRPGLHTWPVLTGSARFKGVKNNHR
ncbi:unnamed protein product, partial [Ectocarpus sp. 12 AP-2014]